MKIQNHGKLVVLSSLASFVSMPSSFAYSSSKRAINSYCEGLRNLLAKNNISIINIQPGFIKTPLTDKNNLVIKGKNRAIDINLKNGYLFSRLKGINAGYRYQYLVMDFKLINHLKSQ